MASPRVFVSYVQENRDLVTRLVEDLRSRDVNVWFDRDALPPGVFWREEIRKAVQDHQYFLACFSIEYATRQRTYMNEELELAIEEIRLRGSAPWFIPVLLSGDLPNRSIGAGRTLRDIQFVDLGRDDWSEAVERIVSVIRGNEPSQKALTVDSSGKSELSFSGVGQDASDPFELQAGLWQVQLSHGGKGHFSVWLLNAEGSRVCLMANETGLFTGSKLVALEHGGQFVLDISASGVWSIRFVQPTRSAALSSISGENQAGTPLLPYTNGLYKFRMSHHGKGHFSVWIFDASGKSRELLANDTGEFAGTKAVQLSTGEYAFDVSTNGQWSVEWRKI